MKKIVLLSAIFVLSLLVAACQPVIDEQKSDFCQNLGEFAQAQVQFRQLDANSTKDDLEDAVSDLERAWNNLADSTEDLAEAQVRGVEEALEDLRRDIDNIPDGSTLAEAEVMIKQDVVSTMAETLQIFRTDCTYGQDQ